MDSNTHLKISYLESGKIDQVCSPLFEHTRFRYIGYNRFNLQEKTWIGLYSDRELVSNSLLQSRTPPLINNSGINIPEGFHLTEDLIAALTAEFTEPSIHKFYKPYKLSKQLNLMKSSFQLVLKHKSYHELFFFSTDLTPQQNRIYCKKMEETLVHFYHHFIWNLKATIINAIPTPWPESTLIPVDALRLTHSNFQLETLNQLFQSSKYRVATERGDRFLSRKETDCYKLYVQGMSGQQIAESLSINHSTYISHLESIKRKTNLIKRSELQEHAHPFDLKK